MVWQNGGEIAYRKGGVWRSGMDSPEAVAAVQFYADLYRNERFAPAGALSWNARDVRKAFEAGDLAMMIGGAWDVRALLGAHPELAGKIGTALLPGRPVRRPGHLRRRQPPRRLRRHRRRRRWPAATSTSSSTRPGWRPSPPRSGSCPEPATPWPPPPPADPLYRPFSAQLEDHSRTYPPTGEWGGFEADGLFTNAVQQVMAGKKTAAEAMKDVAKAMDTAFVRG